MNLNDLAHLVNSNPEGASGELRPFQVKSVDRTERRGTRTLSRTSSHFQNKSLASAKFDLMREINEKSGDQQGSYNLN